jgi:hypothetical protein
MRSHANPPRPDDVAVAGLIRTRYTLEVCVVCGEERVIVARQQATCQCGATASRSFALFRDLQEQQR